MVRGRAGSRAWWRSAGGEVDRPRLAQHPDDSVRKVAITWGGQHAAGASSVKVMSRTSCNASIGCYRTIGHSRDRRSPGPR